MAKKPREIKQEGCLCEKCTFYSGRVITPLEPHSPKDILIIAGAPGEIEYETGLHFRGEEGQTIKKALKDVGIDPSICSYDYIMLCSSKVDKKPTPLQASFCANRVYRNLKIVKPSLVVLIGPAPVKFIFKTNKVANKFGIITRKDGQDYLSISPNLNKSDFNIINRYFESLKIKKNYLNCLTLESIEKAKNILEDNMDTIFSIDVETTGVNLQEENFKILTASISYADYKCIGIPLYHHENNNLKACLEFFEWFLLNKEFKKVTHSKFDYAAIKSFFKIETNSIIADTLLMQYLLDENRQGSGYALKKLSWEYLRFGGFSLANESYEDESLEEVLYYNNSDTDITRQLFFILHKMIKEEELLFLNYNIQQPASLAIADMELNGAKIDIPYAEKLKIKYETKLIELNNELYSFPDVTPDFNFNSPTQLRTLLFDVWKLPVIKVTDKNNISTDEEVLIALSKKHDLPKKLIEYRKLMKLTNTYVISLLDKEVGEFIYSNYFLFVTKTGRLGSRKPNLQNVPKKNNDIRKMFISRFKGGKLIAMDYKQMEIRMLGNVTGEEELIEMFANKIDAHVWAASRVFGIPMDKVTPEIRSSVKSFDFGIFYGKGAYTVAADLGISMRKAENVVKSLLDPFPKVKEWIKDVHKQIRTKGFLTNIFGRRRRFPQYSYTMEEKHKQELYRQGQNFPIQSCHDLLLWVNIKCNEFFKKEKLKSKIIMENHDELLFDVHPDEIGKVVKECARIMEDFSGLPYDFKIPLEVEVKIGDNWGEMIDYDEYIKLGE